MIAAINIPTFSGDPELVAFSEVVFEVVTVLFEEVPVLFVGVPVLFVAVLISH